MKTALTIAPPPPVRRHRPMPVEPVIFAALLLALTLGINVALPKVEADTAAGTAHKAAPAQAPQVARVAQAN